MASETSQMLTHVGIVQVNFIIQNTPLFAGLTDGTYLRKCGLFTAPVKWSRRWQKAVRVGTVVQGKMPKE